MDQIFVIATGIVLGWLMILFIQWSWVRLSSFWEWYRARSAWTAAAILFLVLVALLRLSAYMADVWQG